MEGRGDAGGWHVYAASSGDSWRWRPLATLAPSGLNVDGERWIGRQCPTGDGRFVVAVVAPWSANNSPAGSDRGAVAYSINARTGVVRPLISGVSLYFFTPACGPGSTVALTAYAGADERSTELVLADAAAARVLTVRALAGQYADAVPSPDGGFFATSGDTIVHVPADPRAAVTIRARTPGLPFDLVANAAGGADFLVGTSRSASVWHMGTGTARQAGRGIFHQLALFEGAAGRTVAAGVTRLGRDAGIVALPRQSGPVEAASLHGTAYSPAPAQTAGEPAAASGATGGLPTPLLLVTRPRRGGVQHVMWWMSASAAPTSAVVPDFLRAGGAIASSIRLARSAGSGGQGPRTATGQFTSDCAVPRNNVRLQAMQPSPQDVAWAANLAGRSVLTGGAARPAGYDNLGLPAYSPSRDFPLPAPFGPGGASIPREVLEGIFAQESNFDQASPHSVQGVAGNPLIADYYGAGGGYVPGVTAPDCGYGLGQVTTGMHAGEMPDALQRKVAADYAENVAASAQILAEKWNELKAAGITANNAQPKDLENWYLALWDYNSGLHPKTRAGPWGLGWSNNPVNPVYPYNRETFLVHWKNGDPVVTYGDAATPGNWPYQEKVFGWIEVPIRSPLTGYSSYTGTVVEYPNIIYADAFTLSLPGIDDFCNYADNACQSAYCSRAVYKSDCNPNTSDKAGPCTLPDYECWWHLPDTWCGSFKNPCNTGIWEYSQGAPEPPAQSAAYYPSPTCSVTSTDIPPGTDIVDSQPAAVNLQGCTTANMNWHDNGSFAFTYGDPAVPGSQQTDMDVHQLGTGLGGHIWFTHTNEPTDARGVSLWGVTGTWTPDITAGRYQVKVFVPPAGATATQARYTINDGYGMTYQVSIDQNSYSDAWVPLGSWWLGLGATVSLTNLHVTSGGDLAFSGMAFVPDPGGSYAALGDAYASGEGAPPYDSGTDTASGQCHRSASAYPRQLFATVRPAARIVHAACAGAQITNILATGQYNEEPQLKQIPSDSALVTVTVGAEDAGLGDVFSNCVKDDGCEKYYTQDGKNINEDVKIAGLEPQLANLFRAIRLKAPHAMVIVLTYPNIFKPTTSGTGCGDLKALQPHDIEWLIAETSNLDNTIIKAAQQAGVLALDERYALAGHELCAKDPWVNGRGPGSEALRPTAAGYKQMAADLASALAQKRRSFSPAYVNLRSPRPGTPDAATALELLRLLQTGTYMGAGYSRNFFGGFLRVPSVVTGFSPSCTTDRWVFQRDNDRPGYVKKQCDPKGGIWYTPYDNPLTTPQVPITWGSNYDSKSLYALRADHVVPLKDAYANGARNWTDIQMINDFSNDWRGLELLTTSNTTNSSKMDFSIEEWQPPNTSYVCAYAEMWVAIKYDWEIRIDPTTILPRATTDERDLLTNELTICSKKPAGVRHPAGAGQDHLPGR